MALTVGELDTLLYLYKDVLNVNEARQRFCGDDNPIAVCDIDVRDGRTRFTHGTSGLPVGCFYFQDGTDTAHWIAYRKSRRYGTPGPVARGEVPMTPRPTTRPLMRQSVQVFDPSYPEGPYSTIWKDFRGYAESAFSGYDFLMLTPARAMQHLSNDTFCQTWSLAFMMSATGHTGMEEMLRNADDRSKIVDIVYWFITSDIFSSYVFDEVAPSAINRWLKINHQSYKEDGVLDIKVPQYRALLDRIRSGNGRRMFKNMLYGDLGTYQQLPVLCVEAPR